MLLDVCLALQESMMIHTTRILLEANTLNNILLAKMECFLQTFFFCINVFLETAAKQNPSLFDTQKVHFCWQENNFIVQFVFLWVNEANVKHDDYWCQN